MKYKKSQIEMKKHRVHQLKMNSTGDPLSNKKKVYKPELKSSLSLRKRQTRVIALPQIQQI